MTKSKRTITVVTPCYNEGQRVIECHAAIKAVFDKELPNYDLEHLFVDNCSSDDTPDILRELANEDGTISLVFNARNVGVLKSIFNALRHATGDAVVVMMAVDLQDPPEMIVDFVRQWEQGYEVVQGERVRRVQGWFTQFVRHTYYLLVRKLAQIEIPADVGEFQLIDRKVLENLLMIRDHDPYIRGLIAYCGFKTCRLPYALRESNRGFSHLRFFMLLDLALNGLLTFSKKPIRTMTIAGILVALGSVLYAIANFVWVVLIDSNSIGSGAPTIIVGFFFLMGLNFMFLGLIGEYVLAIHNQVRFGSHVAESDVIPRKTKSKK